MCAVGNLHWHSTERASARVNVMYRQSVQLQDDGNGERETSTALLDEANNVVVLQDHIACLKLVLFLLA
jgi:hypothetical protein